MCLTERVRIFGRLDPHKFYFIDELASIDIAFVLTFNIVNFNFYCNNTFYIFYM